MHCQITFKISVTISFGPREEKEATKGASVSLLVTSLFSIVARGFLKNIIVDSCIKSFLPKQKFNLVSKSCAKAKYCKITKENKY